MIVKLTPQILFSARRYILAHIRGANLCCLCAVLHLGGSYVARGDDFQVYPYEPVVLSIPHNTNHLAFDYFTEVLITDSTGKKTTNRVSHLNLIGVSGGASLFYLIDGNTNYFVVPGAYQAEIEGITNSIEVLEPVGQDSNLVSILKNHSLYRIMLSVGKEPTDIYMKAQCEQILALSPTGHYAIFAQAFFGVDDLYADLAGLVQFGVTNLDYSTVGDQVVSLTIPENCLKWMILYNKGYAFGMRHDVQSAIQAFTALTNGISFSPWSKHAEQFLSELRE